RRTLLDDRRDEQVAAPKKLVAARRGGGIAGMMEPKSAHDRQARAVRVAHGGVEVRHQPIAQLEVFAADRLDLFVVHLRRIDPEAARLRRAAIAAVPSPRETQVPVPTVRSKHRTERAELEPSHIELAGQLGGRDETTDVGSPIWKP